MIMMGGNMDPHQAFMVSRGVKTLSLRVDKAQASAMTIAITKRTLRNVSSMFRSGIVLALKKEPK